MIKEIYSGHTFEITDNKLTTFRICHRGILGAKDSFEEGRFPMPGRLYKPWLVSHKAFLKGVEGSAVRREGLSVNRAKKVDAGEG